MFRLLCHRWIIQIFYVKAIQCHTLSQVCETLNRIVEYSPFEDFPWNIRMLLFILSFSFLKKSAVPNKTLAIKWKFKSINHRLLREFNGLKVFEQLNISSIVLHKQQCTTARITISQHFFRIYSILQSMTTKNTSKIFISRSYVCQYRWSFFNCTSIQPIVAFFCMCSYIFFFQLEITTIKKII